jgi:hypothetical protein
MQMYNGRIKCNVPHKLSSVLVRRGPYAGILLESDFISLVVILKLQIIIIIIAETKLLHQKLHTFRICTTTHNFSTQHQVSPKYRHLIKPCYYY